MESGETVSYALSALTHSKTNEDLSTIIHELRDRFDLANLAYHAPRPGTGAGAHDILLGTGNSDFSAHYVERGYADINPVMREVRRTSIPVDWDTVDHTSTSAKSYFNELKRYEIGRRGMTIPCFTLEDGIGFLSFSTNHKRDGDWWEFRDERAPYLTYVGLHLHATAMRIAHSVPSRAKVKLTPQGRRLLTMFAQGHTPAVIASLTDLSIHTVRMHLKNVQDRLDCKTKAEAIKKALDLGLISTKVRMVVGGLLVENLLEMPGFASSLLNLV